MKKKLVIFSMGMLSWVTTYAQQDSALVRTVVVENQYNPTVMDASKINVLPKVEEPVVPKARIEYANAVRPVSMWDYQAMQPIVKEWKADDVYRGYMRAGYGNNGNVEARLGYLWDISKKDRLNATVSFGGWNGDLAGINNQDWESRLYHTRIGMDYRHASQKVDFLLGGSFRSQVFNYMETVSAPEDEIYTAETVPFAGRQRQTFAHAYMGFTSVDKGLPIQFKAELGAKLFQEHHPEMALEGKNKETNLYLKGDVWKQNSDESRYGAIVGLDSYSDTDDWLALNFNPYYMFQKGNWKIRIGAHVDWVGKNDEKLYLSPDVKAEFLFADRYVLFAKAGGGRETSGLYELAGMSPYFYGNHFTPTYTTLDAAFGLKASPANGWWFLVSGGYQIRENDVCWTLMEKIPFWYADNLYGKTNVLYGAVELKYDYKDLLDFSLKGAYYHWDWKNDHFKEVPSGLPLSLKPQMEVKTEIGFKPLQGLRVNAGYEYVKHCNDLGGDPVSNLCIGADYVILKNMNLFAKVNNLLNKEYISSYVYPAQKLNLMAGISFQF